MLIKKQEIEYNKAQTDRYMSKQLTRIGGKVFENTDHVVNVHRN